MNDYTVFVDSSADIDPSLRKDHELYEISMSYTLGEEQRTCLMAEDDETRTGFYDLLRNGVMPHTSQVSPQQFIEAFEPVLRSGRDVLYISLSGGLTNTHDSIFLAKQVLSDSCPDRRVCAVDSLCATGGMGLLAEVAVRNRENGMSLDGNLACMEALRHSNAVGLQDLLALILMNVHAT